MAQIAHDDKPKEKAMELAELRETQTRRCTGCGTAVTDEGWHAGPHEYVSDEYGTLTCRGYQIGNRVDYDAWHAAVTNDDFGDRPYFRVWGSGEPMRGVPSWFDDAAPIGDRYNPSRG